MGLISRVSSRTYRKSYTHHLTWVLDVIHGTSAERPVAASRRCTRSESSSSDDRPPTPRSWPSACTPCARWAVTPSSARSVSTNTRIVDVVYNATSNELIRTKTLVKGAVLMIDATPFRSYYESHYAKALGRKKGHNFTDEEKAAVEKLDNCGPETKKKISARNSVVAGNLNSQFLQGKLLAKISSRPGQCGRADGYILEGEELDFYVKKLKTKKSKA